MDPLRLNDLYDRLLTAYGPQGWWPGAGDRWVVALGAILTQRTAWRNAEQALDGLRKAGLLTVRALSAAPRETIERAIRSSGFYRAKAATLQAFAEHVVQAHRGDLGRLLGQPTDVARCELLARRGIGPETADAILLYAGGHPTFVIDAYAQRLLTRLGWIGGSETDDALRAAFQRALHGDVARANEYHALIVRHDKEHCRRRPLCPDCPLLSLCPAVEATSPEGVR